MELNDLENYRDSNGFIDLDKIPNFKNYKVRDELRGSDDRDKAWYKFDDTSFLVKADFFDKEDSSNYALYSELVIEELAKQVGQECAHCDLIMLNGKKGVLSQNILKENEELVSFRELIGDSQDEDEFETTTSLEFVFSRLIEVCKNLNLTKNEIRNILLDTQKRFAFEIMTLSTDKHTENQSLLVEDGKISGISPSYDNERALMMDIPKMYLQDIIDGNLDAETYSRLQNPSISLSLNDNGAPVGELIKKINYTAPISEEWQDTLEYLCESEKVENYVKTLLDNLDLPKAFENVEQRISAPIPEEIKIVSQKGFDIRKKLAIESLALDLEYNGNDDLSI